MKRKYWIIALSILVLLIIVSVATVIILNYSNSSTSSTQDGTKIGPLTLYYIAVDDNGKSGTKIGCGDSVVAVKTKTVTTDNSVKSTFDSLLSDHDALYGKDNLYNVLHYSILSYVSSTTSGDTVTVKLSGDLNLAGVCDSPRVQSVLELSAKTAAGVSKADIFINDKPLSELLSLK